MHLAQPADGRAAKNPRRASGPQARQLAGLEVKCRCIAGQRQHAEQIRLHVIEVERLARTAPLLRPPRARGNAGECFDFLQFALRRQHELLADLEQSYAWLLAAQILARGPYQPGPQRHAHLAQIGGDRIAERQRRDTRKQLPLQRGIDEGIRDDFAVAAVGHGGEEALIAHVRLR